MPKGGAPHGGVFSRQYGAAPDTLLIHCSLAHHGAWAPLIAATRLQGIAFDLPGHGRSGDWDGTTDYQALAAAQAKSFCDRPLHVIGHSFGATVALRLALEQPERVRSLVLIEPVFFAAAGGTPELAAYDAAFAPFIAAMAAGAREKAAACFTDIWGAGLPWTEMPKSQRRYITDRIHLIPACKPSIGDDNASQLAAGRLEALDVPTLLLRADRSHPVTRAINETLARRLSAAATALIKGTGHMGPITDPQLYADPIRDFRKTL